MKKIILLSAIFILIFGVSLAIYITSNYENINFSNYEQWQQLSNAKVSKNG